MHCKKRERITSAILVLVAEVAKKIAKEKYGLTVELIPFNDYVMPNVALSQAILMHINISLISMFSLKNEVVNLPSSGKLLFIL